MLDASKSRHIADAQERPASEANPARPLRIVLVFQGGGALGAYQAGVYQALREAGIEPDWLIGTSIGAINASLIAGNAPENRLDRLEEFWRRMKRKELWGLANWPGLADTASYWSTLLAGIPGFFKPNPLAFLGAHYPLGRDSAGFYSTAPLAETLTELVDFALIERCTPRLTVGAAHVRTSKMRYFDSRETAITVEHVMASGALPPAFPAVAEFSPTRRPRRSSTTTRAATPSFSPCTCGTRWDRSRRASGRCFTARRTFNIRAAWRVILRDSVRSTSCATWSRSSSN
jgi:NTE family protein